MAKKNKIMNPNLANQTLRVKDGKGGMLDVECDVDGCAEVSEEVYKALIGTPGWSDPVKRAPRKAPKRPAKLVESEEASEDEEDEEEAEEGEEGEETPPYEEWDYKELKKEARSREDADPKFQPPDSAKTEDIIKALEADDARQG